MARDLLSLKMFTISQDLTIEAMVAIGERASADYSNVAFARRDARAVKRKTVSEIATLTLEPSS